MSARWNRDPGMSRKPSPEGIFTRKLKNALGRQFPSSRWWKNHGNAYSENGLSDLCGCLGGRMVAIEVKYNNGTFSPLQVDFLRDVKRAGGLGIGIMLLNKEVWIIPVESMGIKGNRHRELWMKIDFPKGLKHLEYLE